MAGDPEMHPETPLYKAVYSGKEEDVRRVLRDATQKATINTVCNKFYRTALGLAIFHTKPDIVSLLLDRGADINAVGGMYWTALGVAVCKGDENIMSLLLDRGAYINVIGGIYRTSLSVAIYHDKENIVSLLLDRGADINNCGRRTWDCIVPGCTQGK